MFINKLESPYQSQCLVDRTSDRQIIDSYLTNNLVWVDDEQAAKRDACIIQKDSVIR